MVLLMSIIINYIEVFSCCQVTYQQTNSTVLYLEQIWKIFWEKKYRQDYEVIVSL
jgi:hypothetical protein